MLTKNEFISSVMSEVAHKPKEWRNGQAVYNYTAALFGDVARIVHTEYDIDCFYRDNDIDIFLDKCYEVYQGLQKQ